MRVFASVVTALGLAAPWWTSSAHAADVPADPSDYQTLLGALQPGDRLVLAPGTYTRLTIDGLHGEPDAWITITGPAEGDPAVVVGESCCNTVQIYDSSYVAIANLVIDAQGLYVDAINAKDSSSHDILVEGNTMQGFPADSQQIVGVNTKTTVWNWTIRGNTIIEAGTGIYLGGSEGDTPFIAGVIENNLVLNPLGYCMQVKHQNDYTPTPEMPAGPNVTIVRNNVFIKDDRASPDGDRPNLLVGGFPDAGPGAEDTYHVYGNLLFYNPREALFQATGRMSVHDNIFVGGSPSFPALAVTSHQGKSVKLAYVYNNTVYTPGTGISFSQAAETDDAVVGNLVFASAPISGSIADLRDNIEATEAEAADYVAAPAVMLGAMDFYPLPGTIVGAAMDMTKLAGDVDFDRDYNGTAKGDFVYRGAYAGEGENPGCPLDAEIKDCGPSGTDGGDTGDSGGDDGQEDGSDSDGGSASATESVSVSADDDGSAEGATQGDGTGSEGAADGDDGGEGGCGCTSGRPPARAMVGWLVAFALLRRRRGAWALLALLGCGDDDGGSGSTATADPSSASAEDADYTCEPMGGTCECAGGCSVGSQPGTGTCPQPPPESGACGLECCVPIDGATTTSTTASSVDASSSAGPSCDCASLPACATPPEEDCGGQYPESRCCTDGAPQTCTCIDPCDGGFPCCTLQPGCS